jgi:uncharacterized protein (DUF2235 family)
VSRCCAVASGTAPGMESAVWLLTPPALAGRMVMRRRRRGEYRQFFNDGVAKSYIGGVEEQMRRNIVICCDGTGNNLDVAKSNVVRLFSIARRDDPDSQVAYYHPGIGTMPAKAALTSLSRMATKLAGAGFGYGLLDNVADLYASLMDTYRKDDRVFLFGFSRGAFTVRVLAGLLHRCGLLLPDFKNLIPYALDLYRPHKPLETVIAEFRALFSQPCRIHFLGLWDSVKAYGAIVPQSLPHLRFNESVDFVRHALALEERRSIFAPTTWGGVDSDSGARPPRSIPAGQDVMEVWSQAVTRMSAAGTPRPVGVFTSNRSSG